MLSIITNNTAKQHLNSWLTDVQLCRAGFNKARGERQTKRQRERKRRKKEGKRWTEKAAEEEI